MLKLSLLLCFVFEHILFWPNFPYSSYMPNKTTLICVFVDLYFLTLVSVSSWIATDDCKCTKIYAILYDNIGILNLWKWNFTVLFSNSKVNQESYIHNSQIDVLLAYVSPLHSRETSQIGWIMDKYMRPNARISLHHIKWTPILSNPFTWSIIPHVLTSFLYTEFYAVRRSALQPTSIWNRFLGIE